MAEEKKLVDVNSLISDDEATNEVDVSSLIDDAPEPVKKKESTNLQSPSPSIPIPGKMSSSQLGLDEVVSPSGVAQSPSLQPSIPVKKEKVSPKSGFDWSFDQASKDFQAETGVTPPAVSTIGKQSDALAIKKGEIADPNVSSQEKLKKIRTMSGIDQLSQYQGLIDQLTTQTHDESNILQKQLTDQDAQLAEYTKVLEDPAVPQEQKAGMMDEYNGLIEARNTGANEFNKRLDAGAKLMDAQVLNNHGHQILQKYADNEVGDGDVFLRSMYNAIVPATINGLGRSIQTVGILPVAGAKQLEDLMGDDAISHIAGEYLHNLGKSLEEEIPQDAQGSILKDFTLRKASNVAGQVTGSILSMLIPAGLVGKGGKAIAFASSTNQAMGTTYDSAKEAGLSDKEAAMMSSIVAPIIGALDATGVESVLKNISRDELSKMLIKGAAKSLAGEATEKGIVEAVQKSFTETIAELAKSGGKTMVEEGVTEGLQDVVDKTSKVIVNKIKGEDTYGEQFGKEGMTQIAESMLVGGLAGGVMGTVTGGQSKKSVYENALETGSSPERMEQFKNTVEMSVRNGVMTQEEADNTINNVNAIVEADKVIPDNIQDVDKRIEAVNLINERNRLVEKIEGKDPALSLPTKQRIDGINARLTEISTGQKPDVSKREGETKPQTAEEKATEAQAKTPQVEPLIKEDVVEEKPVEKIVEKNKFTPQEQDEFDILSLEKENDIIDEVGQKRLDELNMLNQGAELTQEETKTIEDGKETQKTEVLKTTEDEKIDTGSEKPVEAKGGTKLKGPKDEGAVKSTSKSKRPRGNPEINKALSHETTDARDLVLQYFVMGNKMLSSAVAEVIGRNKSGKMKGEGSIRSLMMDNTIGKSINGMAHALWQQHGEETGIESDGFRDAIERVILDHNSTASMVKELNDKYAKPESTEGMSAEEKHYRRIYGNPELESGLLIDDMTDEEAQKLYDEMGTPEFEKAMDELHDDLEKEYAEQRKQSVRDAVNNKFDKLNDLIDKVRYFGVSEEIKKKGLDEKSMIPLKSLLDTIRKLTLKAVDAGFTVEEAVQGALDKVKKLPMYKRLIDDGVIDDKVFTQEVKDQFIETKPQEAVVDKSEPKEKVKEKKVDRMVDGEPLKKGEEKKSLLNRMFHASNISPELKERIKKHGLAYSVFSNEEADTIAKGIVKSEGIEGAMNVARSSTEIPGSVKTLIYANVINEYYAAESSAKNDAEKNHAATMQGVIADELDKFLRDSGRAISAVQKFYKMSAMGIASKEIAGLKRQGAEKVAKKGLAGKKDAIAKEFNSIDESVPREASVPKTKKEKITKIREKRAGLLDELKQTWNSLGFAATPENNAKLQEKQIALIAKIAGTYVEEGVVRVNDLIKKIRRDVRKAVGFKISDEDLQLILNSPTEEGKTLNEKINEASEKTPLTKEEEDNIRKQKLAVLNKLLPQKKGQSPRERISDHEKIIKAYDNGAFDGAARTYKNEKGETTSETFEDLIYDKYGILNTNKPEFRKKMEGFAKDIKNAPDGSALQGKAYQNMYDYIGEQQSKSYVELGMGIWYANILSSYETHLRNLKFNLFTTVIGQSMLLAEKAILRGKPLEFRQIMFDGVTAMAEAFTEAKQILKTGNPSRFEKPGIKNELEKSKSRFLSLHKIPGRALRAVDILFTVPLYEMKQREMMLQYVKKEAKDAGMSISDATIRNKVDEYLSKTKQRISSAEKRASADMEKYYGEDWKNNKEAKVYYSIRVSEIMEETRPQAVKDEAIEWAKRSVLTNEPRGIWKSMAGAFHKFGEIPGGKLVVPFVNIVMNLTDRFIEKSPIGFVNAIRGKKGFGATEEKLTSDERYELTLKAINYTAGTLALMAATSLGRDGDDDDDADLVITGKNTGDYSKDKSLEEGGKKDPYSVYVWGHKVFEYKDTPLSSIFAPVGYYRDYVKYGKNDGVENGLVKSAFDYLAFAVDQNAVKGLKEFIGGLSPDKYRETDVASTAKKLASLSQNFYTPNILKAVNNDVRGAFGWNDYKAETWKEAFFKDIPFAEQLMTTEKYDHLGQPIKDQFKIPFVPNEKWQPVDKYYKFFTDKKFFPSYMNDRKVVVGNKRKNSTEFEEVELSGEQFKALHKLRGEAVKAVLDSKGVMDTMSKMSNEDFSDQMSIILSGAGKIAKAKMFGGKEVLSEIEPETSKGEDFRDKRFKKKLRLLVKKVGKTKE